MIRLLLPTLVSLSLLIPAVAQELPSPATRTVDFAKDIQPLLQTHCWSCHGQEKQESGLRLDRHASVLEGGDLGRIVLPGRSAESRLIHYVAGTNPDSVMPPEGEGERLSAEAIALLRAWIDQGVKWSGSGADADARNSHWAYQPLKVTDPPTVRPSAWPVNAIDQFVLAALEQRGLTPSVEADRYTLIRRVALDLTGLLPTVAEVDAFVHDQSPDAYERLVDRQLASPHFGERWGRHWLDMARYADSDGYEKDNPRPDAWRWRDWVIDAINSDMPFDQFTIEQLAGDLLPEATPLQRLATAFHRQTLTNTEGGTDQEEFRVAACFDRTETTGVIWLGLTVGCARCHSHKYDAISQREYYQLFAVFNNGDEQTTVVPKSDAEMAAWQVAKAAWDVQFNELESRLRAEQDRLKPQQEDWENRLRTQLARTEASPVRLHALDAVRAVSDGATKLRVQKDGSVLAAGDNPETAVYTVRGSTTVSDITSVRLDVLPHKSLPASGPGRVAHGNFVLNEVTLEVSANADFSDARSLPFEFARADFEQVDRPWLAKNVIDGQSDTGWAIGPEYGKPHWLVLGLRQPLTVSGILHVRIRLSQLYGKQHTLGHFRLSLQTGLDPGVTLPDAVITALKTPVDQRSDAQRQDVLDHFSRQEATTRDLLTQRDELRKKEPPRPELTVRVITQRTQDPRKTYVLKRGEFLSPLTDLEMDPGGLAVLPAMRPRTSGARADRLDLARWLVSAENPLTPRVTVNHFWRILFGQGLVRTPGDFGVRGEKPSHPELLDWLAAEFIGLNASPSEGPAIQRWSRKALLKQILMSATYRQSSRYRPELRDVDPQNVWLARQNRLRVEGEIVGDLGLDVAGLLARRVGGPSVYPPLPPGIAELSYAGNFKWNVSPGEDRYRRGMYTFFKRTSPHPSLIAFDCPDANITCVQRQASNTPLQALTSLNNETFSETSRAFAKRVLTMPLSDSATRLTMAFRLCVARPPKAEELQELTVLLEESRAWFQAHAEEASQLVAKDAVASVAVGEQAAWIATCRILLNLDEFITRE